MSIQIESCRNSIENPYSQSKAILPMIENPQNKAQNDINEDNAMSSNVESRTCTECRKSKVKCDKQDPCNRCTRLNLACIAQKRGRGRPSMPKGSIATRKNYVKGLAQQQHQRGSKSEDNEEEAEQELRPKRKREMRKSYSNQPVVTPDSDITTTHYLSPNANKSSPQTVTFTSSASDAEFRENKNFSAANIQNLKFHCKQYDGNSNYLVGEYSHHRTGRSVPPHSNMTSLPQYRNSMDRSTQLHQITQNIECNSKSMNRPHEDHHNQVVPQWSNISGNMVQLNEPTDLMVSAFWKMSNNSEVSLSKSLAVIRHWVQIALNRHSLVLLSKSLEMGRSLGFEFSQIVNDVEMKNSFHELAENSSRYHNAPSPLTSGPLEIPFPDHIQALNINMCAVSQRLVVRGRSRFVNNEMWAKSFMSSEEANNMYAENSGDVWGSVIHPNDHLEFYEGIASQLFKLPCMKTEKQFLLYCVDAKGNYFPALIRFRSCFLEGGDVAAYALLVDRVPQSKYVQMAPPNARSSQLITNINNCTFDNMYNAASLAHQHERAVSTLSSHSLTMNSGKLNGRKELQEINNKANDPKFRLSEHQPRFESSMFASSQTSIKDEDFGIVMPSNGSSYLNQNQYSISEGSLMKESGGYIDSYDPTLSSNLLNVGEFSRFSTHSPFESSSTGDMEDVVLNDILNITQADYTNLVGPFKQGMLDGSDIPCLTFETMMRDST